MTDAEPTLEPAPNAEISADFDLQLEPERLAQLRPKLHALLENFRLLDTLEQPDTEPL